MAKKIVKWSTILLLLATPLFNYHANQNREVAGFGGECLVFTLPLLFYACYLSMRGLLEIAMEECFYD